MRTRQSYTPQINRYKKIPPLIELTYAGGIVGDIGVSVCGAPAFEDGHRYLICMFDDGNNYFNPIVGGPQGLFEVVKDEASQEEFVLTAGGKAIVGINTSGITASRGRVSHIKEGLAVYKEPRDTIPDLFFDQPPTSSDPSATATVSYPADRRKYDNLPPLRLEEFLNYIGNVALRLPLEKRILKLNGHGSFYKRNKDGKIEAHKLPLSRPTARILDIVPDYNEDSYVQDEEPFEDDSSHTTSAEQFESDSITPRGGTVGLCGVFDLLIIYQQVPTSNPSYNENLGNLGIWQYFMDFFGNTTPNSGGFEFNNVNEFCGFVNNATMNNVYGLSWGSAIGKNMHVYPSGQTNCSERVWIESDIALNPAIGWSSDPGVAIGNNNVALYGPIIIHELGHTLGIQTGTFNETYDYDVPTVMQMHYHGMVQDGRGLHVKDVQLIRNHYSNQTGIKNVKDVGVESYYPSNGLINSTTNKSSYFPGENITLNNVMTENMSSSAVSNLSLRFYLSSNRTITTSDILMKVYGWFSFPSERFNVNDFTFTIPQNVPSGQYYVGATVSVNGDGFNLNNTTSFYAPITINAPPATSTTTTSTTTSTFITTTTTTTPSSTTATTTSSTTTTTLPSGTCLPTPIGSIWGPSQGEYWNDIQVKGKMAYVAAGGSTGHNPDLLIIDISKSKYPKKRGSYVTPDGSSTGVFVKGKTAYLTGSGMGLHIINVSNPDIPTLLGRYEITGADKVYVKKDKAYVAASQGISNARGLYIIDVSDPTTPKLDSFYNLPSGAFHVYVKGSTAYVAAHDSGLKIINVSNPKNPTPLGSYNTPGHAHGIYVRRNTAYVADTTGGLQIINVSDPTAPNPLGNISKPGDNVQDVFVKGRTAYIADLDWGLQPIDVSDPANPESSGYYDVHDIPDTNRRGVSGVFNSRGKLYVVGGSSLNIINDRRGCISGIVTKISDGSPIAFKVIKIKNITPEKSMLRKQYQADENGLFCITNLKKGTYELKAQSCKDSEPQIVEITTGSRINDVNIQCAQ